MNNVDSTIVINIGVGLLVIGLILRRQLREKKVREEVQPRLVIVLAALGSVQIYQYLSGHLNAVSVNAVSLVFGGLIISAILGYVRAMNMHLWHDKGQLIAKGNWITIILWLLTIVAHIGIDALLRLQGTIAEGFGSATVVISLVVSLISQRYTLIWRAKSLKRTHD